MGDLWRGQPLDRQQHASSAVTGLGVAFATNPLLQRGEVVVVVDRKIDGVASLPKKGNIIQRLDGQRNRTSAKRASEICGMRITPSNKPSPGPIADAATKPSPTKATEKPEPHEARL